MKNLRYQADDVTQQHDARLACLLRLEATAAELHLQIGQLTKIWTAATQHQAYGPVPSVRRRLEMVEQLSKALGVLNRYGQFYRRPKLRPCMPKA
jgi:hypothetical protein